MAGIRRWTVLGAVLLVAGCVESSELVAPERGPMMSLSAMSAAGLQVTGSYILLGNGSKLPANLAANVAALGGRVVTAYGEIGVAIVDGGAADFAQKAAKLAGVESVTPDVYLQWTNPQLARGDAMVEAGPVEVGADVASFADNAFFYSFQWAPAVMQAPEVWNMGITGRGARVAIIDGGLYNAHRDLAPNVDVAASRSFVAGFNYNQDVGTFWHATHVGGIVASSGLVGTAGIAPNATLIGVKALHNGTGSFAAILNAIIYAATPRAEGGAGADIINMSLSGTIDYRNNWADKAFRDAFRELQKVFDRGLRYAYQRGVLVVTSAGNDATNYDVARELFKIPAESQHAMAVSATGPHGWQLGATNFDRPTYYTDFGKSLVDVAAPGGTVGLFVVDGVDQVCVVPGRFTTIVNFCEVFDMIFSTVRGGPTSTASYGWAQGTSMSAPAVAGVAALVIEAKGRMNPLALMALIEASAIDKGKPGQDEFYGHGWVNALRAVTR